PRYRQRRERSRSRGAGSGCEADRGGRDPAACRDSRRRRPSRPRRRRPRVNGLKTSLGIWALGPMITRFVPGGYHPQRPGESTVDRGRRAVDGLGDLMDDYEFHFPQELSEENLDAVRDALDGHDIYCIATGLHLDARFGRGGLVSPDAATRAEAVRRTLAGVDFAGELGANFIIWPGIEGYNYPFQTPYQDSWAWLIDGIGQAAQRCRERGILLFLEHKNSEPAMKIFMRNIGMTLHVIHKLRAQGLDNVKVN